MGLIMCLKDRHNTKNCATELQIREAENAALSDL